MAESNFSQINRNQIIISEMDARDFVFIFSSLKIKRIQKWTLITENIIGSKISSIELCRDFRYQTDFVFTVSNAFAFGLMQISAEKSPNETEQ